MDSDYRRHLITSSSNLHNNFSNPNNNFSNNSSNPNNNFSKIHMLSLNNKYHSKIFTIKDSFSKVKVYTYHHHKTIKRKNDEICDILNMNIYILNNPKIKYFNLIKIFLNYN